MPDFKTHAVLSTSTGRLMGGIDGVYAVTSYLLGRDAYTHELAFYGEAAQTALRAAHPELPSKVDFEHVNGDNYKAVLAEWTAKLGTHMTLSETLRGVLADSRNTIDVLLEMKPDANIVIADLKPAE